MTGTLEWQGRVGEVWAEEWRRTDRSLEPVNRALVACALPLAPATLLDIGCGAGATSLALAEALPSAEITGIDLSEPLVAVARERAGDRPRLRFEVADATTWRPGAGRFELIVSRHGVMFFAEPERAFAHLRSLAVPGGRLLFSCFRRREENEWIAAFRPVFERFAPQEPAAPEPLTGPFAFASRRRIEQVLTAAGFAPPLIEPLDFDFVVGAGGDPVADALRYFTRIGPIARLLAELDEAAREQAAGMIGGIAEGHLADGRVAFRAAGWIVSADAGKERS